VVFAEPHEGSDRDGMVARMAPSLPPLAGLATGTVYPRGVVLSTRRYGLQVLRHLVVLVTGFIAGSRIIDAARSWQEWHSRSVQDPSGADAYRTFFLVNMGVALLSLSIAGLVWWLLRPRGNRSD
jgi:hypothetical protein